LTFITVITGWVIVNWQNNKREERKELRSSLNDIVTNIEALEEDAIRYHTSLDRNIPLEKSITLKITRLSAKVRYLRFESESLKSNFIELKKSITLDNFETSRFSQQTPESDLIDSISYSSDQLKDSLEDEFSKLYRGPLRYRLSAGIRNFLTSCKPLR
jgi:predicted nuclease with TOPRIM domain